MTPEPLTQPSSTPSQAKLILSIGRDGTIIQFNAECERLTGLARADVLHKRFTALLPSNALVNWEMILEKIQKSLLVAPFTLPLLTKSEETINVAWNGFPVCDATHALQSLCLLGLPQGPSESVSDVMPSYGIQLVLNETGTREPGLEPEVSSASPSADSVQHQVRPEALKQIHNDLQALLFRVDSLEKHLEELIRAVGTRERHLTLLPSELHSMLDGNRSPSPSGDIDFKPRKFSLRDPFGFKYQAAQLRKRIEELDRREQQLVEERRLFDLRLEEFCQWKEKLKTLEEEIEHRRVSLLTDPPDVVDSRRQKEEETPSLDAVTESAVVVQRGIIKQINTAFSTLTGYNVEELLERSLFDFIPLEGLAQIEKYYLDHLQGEPIEGYSTILVAKNDARISVNVQITPSRFQGEKAETLLIVPTNEEK